MARRKNPDQETESDSILRKKKERIASSIDHNVRIHWNRKYRSLKEVIKDLEPFEQRIFDIMVERKHLDDKIETIRADLVKNCVHPVELLVQVIDDQDRELFVCKFCERKLRIVGV